MKTEKAREIIIAALKEKTTISSQEINYASKGTIAFVQIYGILKSLINNGSVQLNPSDDGKKFYTLIDESKLNDVVIPAGKTKPEKIKPVEEVGEDGKEEKPKKNGRDLTTYKFNGIVLNKGRLAHAIIAQYAKDRKPSLKAALELFKNEIIPPYGLIKPISEARKINKRFFTRDEEVIKLKDASIAVSNQFTPERIAKVIAIARKELKYTIK